MSGMGFCSERRASEDERESKREKRKRERES